MPFRRNVLKILLTKNAFQILFCQRIVFFIFSTLLLTFKESALKKPCIILNRLKKEHPRGVNGIS